MPARSAARTGWTPRHLVLKDDAGSIVGCAPCYLKSHSQGEYVFDHSWADAYARAGGRLLSQAADRRAVHARAGPAPAGAAGSRREAERGGAGRGRRRSWWRATSSRALHVTFLSEGEWDRLGAARLPAAHRPAVPLAQRRLRHLRRFPGLARLAQAQGGAQGARAGARRRPEIEWLRGRDITEAHWDAFFAFYMDTGSRKWGRPYLNRKFFSLIGAAMRRPLPADAGQARQAADRRRAAT